MIVMHDPPKGRVANVERLLQVLAMLRTSESGVLRSTIKSTVPEYAAERAAITAAEGHAREKAMEALDRKVLRDLEALEEVGFSIDDRCSRARVPLRAAADAVAVAAGARRPGTGDAGVDHAGTAGCRGLESGEQEAAPSYGSLLGALPGSLGLVQAALAGRRSLVIDVDGDEKLVEPAQLASYQGRWFLLVRFPGSEHAYGYRLDRLEVVALGDPLPEAPVRIDPLTVLDPTAWRKNDPEHVELRCDPADADFVGSWFPRAKRVTDGGQAVFTFSCSHREALLDRVIGLAGAVRLMAPEAAVDQLRLRLLPFVEGAA